ncbi:MAG TPA: hypothetical protein VL309_10410 [Vicinamibacterales bacterium]|jgi:hypothetical protein|nr:hypothetical protein [Vicinamibacterales bacterium]
MRGEFVRGRRHLLFGLALVALVCAVWFGPRVEVASGELPHELSDRAFWRMVGEFSEPGGSFRSDNLVSNETAFQHVIPALKQRLPAGGVYLGVGPDQNFTYIAAFHPRMAFIVDIRRQNLLLHLMYKALIEMSDDRADFLSRLFSRARPRGLSKASTPEELFTAYAASAPTEAAYENNLAAILDRLTKHHHFSLSADDRRTIDERVYRMFYASGPDIRYSFPRPYSSQWFPTYAELMQATDESGTNHGYLASEDHYQALRDLERRNMVVPVVGDFGGPRALRSIGAYLRSHGATVTFFYTSNVEQYLFQTDAWRRFFNTVSTLPVDEHSTFIRAFFNMGFRYPPPGYNPSLRSATLVDPIAREVGAFKAGEIQTYYDVVERSR